MDNIINKDTVWTRIKKYIYSIVFLIILLITLSVLNLILNYVNYKQLHLFNLKSQLL